MTLMLGATRGNKTAPPRVSYTQMFSKSVVSI